MRVISVHSSVTDFLLTQILLSTEDPYFVFVSGIRSLSMPDGQFLNFK